MRKPTRAVVVLLVAVALACAVAVLVSRIDLGPAATSTPPEPGAHTRPAPAEPPSRMPSPKPTTAPQPRCPTSAPCHIVIPAMHVDTSMDAKPTQTSWDPFLDRDVSSFGVPDDMTTTTWWSSGPAPGDPGMAVVLGHLHSTGYGVFNHLADLAPGNRVVVDRGHRRLVFRVTDVVGPLPKTDPDALSGALSEHSSTARLALVSCTGGPDATREHLDANLVVFADLARTVRR